MATLLAGMVVLVAGVYLLGLGAAAIVVPARATGYLQAFASSLRVHVIELVARFVVGAALVGYASHMRFGAAFHTFGWVLVITTLGLAVLPWRWHQRFARASVPAALRYPRVIGSASVAAGAFVVWAVAR